jgi:hypothetical protein
MKIELKIPRGWRRVKTGRVKKGDMLSIVFHGPDATAGSWSSTMRHGEYGWSKAVGDLVRNFHCVIRRAT